MYIVHDDIISITWHLAYLSLSVLVLGSGTSSNSLVDFLLLLYKSYIYRNRGKLSQINIKGFKAYIKYYEKIEYYIACKNNKKHIHLTKFERIRTALQEISTTNDGC